MTNRQQHKPGLDPAHCHSPTMAPVPDRTAHTCDTAVDTGVDPGIDAAVGSPQATTDPASTTVNVTREQRSLAGVPILIARPSDRVCHSLVLLSHGFFGNKEAIAAEIGAEGLARNGHFVVAIDNFGHGERGAGGPGSPDRNPKAPISLLTIRTMIRDTADEIPSLIDALATEPGLDLWSVAMIGVSMGGFIAWRAMTLDPRITVAVPAIASAYWEDIPGQLPFTLTGVGEAQSFAAQYNPALRRERFGHQAILALLGAEDPHLDSAKVAAFVESLRPAYARHPERLVAKVYPAVGHQFTDAMRTAALDWLDRHQPTARPAPLGAQSASVRLPLPPAPPRRTSPTSEVDRVTSAAPLSTAAAPSLGSTGSSATAVARTRSFVVPGAPDAVFRLLCPKREEEWIPGWKADTVYAPSGVSAEDAVFRTRLPDGTPLIWVVSRYEPPHRIEFSCVAEDAIVMRLKLHVEAHDAGSRVDFTRTYISIGAKGPAVIETMTEEAFMARTSELRELLTAHLARSS